MRDRSDGIEQRGIGALLRYGLVDDFRRCALSNLVGRIALRGIWAG